MATLDEVNAELAQDKEELDKLNETVPEVYKRIVGYYRATKNWNNGKAEENKHRVEFDAESSLYSGEEKFQDAKDKATAAGFECEACKIPSAGETTKQVDVGFTPKYILITRATCPHCPPVKALVAEYKDIEGKLYDADTEEGLAVAQKYGVMSTPTLIAVDAEGNELGTAHDEVEGKQLLDTIRVGIANAK